MTRRTAASAAALFLAAIAGCYTGPSTGDAPAVTGTSSTDPTDPNNTTSPDEADAAVAEASGLPCDVAKLFATSCTSCHGATPAGGAPSSLVTYDDLTKPSDDDASRTVADVSLERMQAAKRPMPPAGALAADKIKILSDWIEAGLPKGTCGSKSTTDGGTDGSTNAQGDASSPPTPAPTVCTSGLTYSSADGASALMHPGKKCLACHAQTGAPSYEIAGTVYPTIHEPDDCLGSNVTGMKVVIVDAAGVTHTMPVNASGNFYRVTSIPMPYTAMVVNGTQTRAMKNAQTDGDCNNCHTEQGARSPGRIMAP